MGGRNPKPIERQRRLGNPGKRSLPEPQVLIPAAVEPPEPLRPLGSVGTATWNRVWTAGAVWVSPTTDIELVQLLCEDMDERALLRYRVLQQGDWRDRGALREITKRVEVKLSALGFTPSERSRMGVAEVRAMSALEQMRRGG